MRLVRAPSPAGLILCRSDSGTAASWATLTTNSLKSPSRSSSAGSVSSNTRGFSKNRWRTAAPIILRQLEAAARQIGDQRRVGRQERTHRELFGRRPREFGAHQRLRLARIHPAPVEVKPEALVRSIVFQGARERTGHDFDAELLSAFTPRRFVRRFALAGLAARKLPQPGKAVSVAAAGDEKLAAPHDQRDADLDRTRSVHLISSIRFFASSMLRFARGLVGSFSRMRSQLETARPSRPRK